MEANITYIPTTFYFFLDFQVLQGNMNHIPPFPSIHISMVKLRDCYGIVILLHIIRLFITSNAPLQAKIAHSVFKHRFYDTLFPFMLLGRELSYSRRLSMTESGAVVVKTGVGEPILAHAPTDIASEFGFFFNQHAVEDMSLNTLVPYRFNFRFQLL